jgi:hypothetical protein
MNENTISTIINILTNKNRNLNIKRFLNYSENNFIKNSEMDTNINLNFKLIPVERNKIQIKKETLINDAFDIFFEFNEHFEDKEIHELKKELFSIFFEKSFPLIFKFENQHLDMSIYHILNFIKDTKHILTNLELKKRTYHSRFKIDILQKRLQDLENINNEDFLQPRNNYDKKIFNSKRKLLKIFNENYNIVFAYAHLYSFLPMQNITKEKYLEETFQDFLEFVNIISIEKREVLKSLAILLYKTYQNILPNNVIELFTQNVLRIFFENEIKDINKNKLTEMGEDTFLIDSKTYSKSPYIHSVFDKIPIYGINKDNKYFFYKGLNRKEFMKSYIYLLKEFGIKKISLSFYKQIIKPFKNPQMYSFMKQYPEFFDNKDINLLNMQYTFFSEMKKYAPDNLK